MSLITTNSNCSTTDLQSRVKMSLYQMSLKNRVKMSIDKMQNELELKSVEKESEDEINYETSIPKESYLNDLKKSQCFIIIFTYL